MQIDARAAETVDEPDTVDAPPVTATTKTLAVTISGDYQAAKTVEFSETAQVTFYRIPVGAKISLEAKFSLPNRKNLLNLKNQNRLNRQIQVFFM